MIPLGYIRHIGKHNPRTFTTLPDILMMTTAFGDNCYSLNRPCILEKMRRTKYSRFLCAAMALSEGSARMAAKRALAV